MNARPRQALLEFARPRRLAGVDEAGRGPLAGPVVAAAVILDPRRRIRGLADSKVLEPEERERLAILIRERAVAWSVAWADREEIDAINILQATLLAMRRALLGLRVCPDAIQFDGNICPSLEGVGSGCPAVAIVDGDALVPAISAASILAKTFRDAWMRRFDELYPHYGFASHKGYGTPQHHQALDRHGTCPLHRRSFAPVQWAESGVMKVAQLDSSEVASFAMGDVPFGNAVNPSMEAPRRRPASDGPERHIPHRK